MRRTAPVLLLAVWTLMYSFHSRASEVQAVGSNADPRLAALIKPASAADTLRKNQESIEDYAERAGLHKSRTLHLDNSTDLDLVLIPAGTFLMGTPEIKAPFSTISAIIRVGAMLGSLLLLVMTVHSDRKHSGRKRSLLRLAFLSVTAGLAVSVCIPVWNVAAECVATRTNSAETPQHRVTLTKAFYMSKFLVTQELYQAVMHRNPSKFVSKYHPVESVSWNDAREFCNKLGEKLKCSVRLPTEAEWEYACRAGTQTSYYSGGGDADLNRVAWYSDNSMDTTHPVGQKEANAFGLFDMHGNVWQWCQDRFDEDFYSVSPQEDPEGPPKGTERVLRGGSWHYGASYCRSAFRIGFEPSECSSIAGFRVVVTF